MPRKVTRKPARKRQQSKKRTTKRPVVRITFGNIPKKRPSKRKTRTGKRIRHKSTRRR